MPGFPLHAASTAMLCLTIFWSDIFCAESLNESLVSASLPIYVVCFQPKASIASCLVPKDLYLAH